MYPHFYAPDIYLVSKDLVGVPQIRDKWSCAKTFHKLALVRQNKYAWAQVLGIATLEPAHSSRGKASAISVKNVSLSLVCQCIVQSYRGRKTLREAPSAS